MKLRLPAACGMFVLACVIASCGGSASESLSGLQTQSPAESGEPAALEVPGLPPLHRLPEPAHTVSIAGPGWKPIDLHQSGGTVTSEGVSLLEDEAIRMVGGPNMALSLYGVNGFDGDSFPTSVRLTSSFELGEYYIVVADYQKGRWVDVGPFTAGATIQLPDVTEYGPREAYISASNSFFFAIVVTSGSGFDFSTLELGIHSGELGPRPPQLLTLPEGSERLTLTWLHSPDRLDPDFAGYRIERAPLLFGDFAEISEGLVSGDSFVDEGVVPDNQYRYRIAAEDLGGLSGGFLNFQAETATGQLCEPVVVIDGPEGTLYGPAGALFDLTQSYDPEGQEIVAYRVFSPALTPEEFPGGTWLTQLKPGCHLMRFEVETTDGRTGGSLYTVKVFPRWDNPPQLVKEGSTIPGYRLQYPGTIVVPWSGLNATSGWDYSQQAVVLWERGQVATDIAIRKLPTYGDVTNLSDPIELDSNVLMAAAIDDAFWLASFGQDEQFWIPGPAIQGSSALALIEVDVLNAELYMARQGLVSHDIVVADESNLHDTATVKEDLGVISALDVCFEETNQNRHVFYQNGAGVGYIRLNFDLGILDEKQVAGVGVQLIDSGVSNVSGRPGAFLFDGSHYLYSEQDELGDWPLPAAVDNSEMNFQGGSFTASGAKPYCFFAKGLGQANLYEYEAGNWQIRATPLYSSNSCFASAVQEAFGAAGTALDLVDMVSGGEVKTLRVSEGSSEFFEIFSVPKSIGQGYNLHAAAAGAEIHLAWQNLLAGGSGQWISTDFGETWGGTESLPQARLIPGANTSGHIYYSAQELADSVFYYWSGGALVPQWSVPMADSRIIPMLIKRSFNEETAWYGFDPGTGNASLVSGFFDSGVPANDFSEDLFMPDLAPVWGGSITQQLANVGLIALAGGFNPDGSSLVLYSDNDPEYDVLVENMLDYPVNIAADELVRTRATGAVSHSGPLAILPSTSFFCTISDTQSAVRYTTDLIGAEQTHYYEMSYEPLLRDVRRTISTDRARGGTGLVLISDMYGEEIIFEWSNYGEWEPLAVPQALRGASMAELVVDQFGNWHIFYRDPHTDNIWQLRANDMP